MHVELDDNMKITNVQEVFNSLFPFLKIEFFEQEIKINGSIATRRHISNGNRKLGEFRNRTKASNNISIFPNLTVSELEHNFVTIYALQSQVFRKSGKVWLETTVTDSWTLEEQNRQGELITAQMNLNRV